MTRSRARIGVAVAVATAALVAVAALAFAGGGEDGGKLAWAGKPQVFQSGKATDSVMSAKVRNVSREPMTVDTLDIRVLDAEGKELKSTARFLAAYMHGRYSWSMRGDDPRDLGADERERMGEIAVLKPGEEAPFTASWRVPQGGKQPVRIDFGKTTVRLP